jgi:hypothetical protein
MIRNNLTISDKKLFVFCKEGCLIATAPSDICVKRKLSAPAKRLKPALIATAGRRNSCFKRNFLLPWTEGRTEKW